MHGNFQETCRETFRDTRCIGAWRVRNCGEGGSEVLLCELEGGRG